MSDYLQNSKKYKGFHYSELGEEALSYLHSRGLEILKEVISVFERFGIEYMICGGTLLGAQTTGKFIPWDDDIDICVKEECYEKMIDALIENLPEDMIVQCEKTEPNYYHGWIKVRDIYSHVYPDAPIYSNNGVWIDIYKLKRLDENEIEYEKAKEHVAYLKRRTATGDISKEEMNRRIVAAGLEKLLTDDGINKSGNMKYVIWSASKIVAGSDECFPVKKYPFEGLELSSFNNAEQYLINHYGVNYQELPEDELRRVGINKIEVLR